MHMHAQILPSSFVVVSVLNFQVLFLGVRGMLLFANLSSATQACRFPPK
jgi:hypothetical protein